MGILIVEDTITNRAVVAVVASSVAIVFFVPHSVALKPLRLIRGHLSAIASTLCTVGMMMLLPHAFAANQIMIHALQGMSLAPVILFMTVTNTEHAPAAGTALGLAIWVPINSVIFILSAAVIISIVHIALFGHLHNLI